MPASTRLFASFAATFVATALPMAVPAQQPLPHWAFQPMAHAVPPEVDDAAWNQNPIDRFVFAELQAHGLHPNPAADKRTLLRRACQDLIGLPPTPQQMAAFLADERPEAFAAVVEQLLAQPQYGERWGRSWLDLARYSDSNGLDENLAFAAAFRYRDWVVRSLNDDMPYDRFASMQLAGDLMPGSEQEHQDGIVATGFLALGPKLLAEQDKAKLVMDTVDEQLDLVGKTFLGLTLGCARCHDHKFDPVPTRDYYAMAGIFKSTATFENLDHVSRWVETPLASQQQLDEHKTRSAAAAAAEQALQQAKAAAMLSAPRQLLSQLSACLTTAPLLQAHAVLREAESAERTNLHKDSDHWGAAGCTVLHTSGGGEQFAEYDIDVPEAGAHELQVRLASKEMRPLDVRLDGKPLLTNVLAVTTADWYPAQQQWFTAGTLTLTAGRHTLRLSAHGPHMPHLDKWLLAPAADSPWSLAQLARERGIAVAPLRSAAFLLADSRHALARSFALLAGSAGNSVAGSSSAAGSDDAGRWPFTALFGAPRPRTDAELAGRWQLLFSTTWQAWQDLQATKSPPTALPEASLETLRQWLLGYGGLLELRPDELLQQLDEPTQQQLAALTTARDAAVLAVPAAPPQAICVREGEPTDVPVHLRGSHLNLAAEAVPRGFLSALAGMVQAPSLPRDHSGRLQLAQWLFLPEHPLTARVMVNRIWQGHFGQGLVRSPSNFGIRGAAPTHPALLDYLAREFQARGWSIKAMHRLVLSSRTWQQASTHSAEAEAIDPENLLLWRQNRWRLQAEYVRDAMLAVAGDLDPDLGGSLLPTKDRDYVTNDQSNDKASYDAPRRSLYLPIIRNAMYEVFTAFDYADPSVHLEQRSESAIAPQALVLMNSPLVLQQSRLLAQRVLGADGGEPEHLLRLWQLTYQRAPTAVERQRAAAYLAARAADLSPATDVVAIWQPLCQVLLASNEFLYVD